MILRYIINLIIAFQEKKKKTQSHWMYKMIVRCISISQMFLDKMTIIICITFCRKYGSQSLIFSFWWINTCLQIVENQSHMPLAGIFTEEKNNQGKIHYPLKISVWVKHIPPECCKISPYLEMEICLVPLCQVLEQQKVVGARSSPKEREKTQLCNTEII